MSKSRFYRETYDGIDAISDKFTNPESDCSVGSTAYIQFDNEILDEDRFSVSYNSQSANLFRKDAGSKTVVGITPSKLRDVNITKDVSSVEPKKQCSAIQEFFRSYGVKDKTALATMCSTTAEEITKTLSANGHTVEYRKKS